MISQSYHEAGYIAKTPYLVSSYSQSSPYIKRLIPCRIFRMLSSLFRYHSSNSSWFFKPFSFINSISSSLLNLFISFYIVKNGMFHSIEAKMYFFKRLIPTIYFITFPVRCPRSTHPDLHFSSCFIIHFCKIIEEHINKRSFANRMDLIIRQRTFHPFVQTLRCIFR